MPVVACDCAVCTSTDWRDKHLRTSALIETDEGKNVLIDIGPDFREQMLRHKVMHLDAIFVTHAHRDHVAGIDDIRSYNYVQRQAMDIYGNEEALRTIRHDYGYIFSDFRYPGLPEANLLPLRGDEVLHIGRQLVQPIRGMHKTLPVLGFRIGPIGYLTDMNFIARDELSKLRGVQLLVVNALRHEPHFSHFCLSEALQLIETVQPRQAFLTHVSHQMGLYAEVEQELPAGVQLGYDGLSVDLPIDEANFAWAPQGSPKEYERPAPTKRDERMFVGPGSSPDGSQSVPDKTDEGSLPYYSDASAPRK